MKNMIAKIIEYSARNKFIIFLLVFSSSHGATGRLSIHLRCHTGLSDIRSLYLRNGRGEARTLWKSQITYPITSTLLAAPKVQAVRGFSFLGSSFIYVIFEEGTDIYWARSRVLEYLQAVKNKLPCLTSSHSRPCRNKRWMGVFLRSG